MRPQYKKEMEKEQYTPKYTVSEGTDKIVDSLVMLYKLGDSFSDGLAIVVGENAVDNIFNEEYYPLFESMCILLEKYLLNSIFENVTIRGQITEI